MNVLPQASQSAVLPVWLADLRVITGGCVLINGKKLPVDVLPSSVYTDFEAGNTRGRAIVRAGKSVCLSAVIAGTQNKK